MRLVVAAARGEVSINVMWLPTWLAMNTPMRLELEAEIAPQLVGQDLTDEMLEKAHEVVLEFFERKFPNVLGLRDYLDALKFVSLTP